MGERGCNLQLARLEKYSIQVLNSIKQYRIFWKILVKLDIFPNSPTRGENKNLWNHYLRFFFSWNSPWHIWMWSDKMQTVLSSFSANAIPWQVDALHNRVDFQCFGKGLWNQRCQTMSNHVKPESLQCDLRQYIATGRCNHGKPTKIHEPNHTLPTNRRLFESFRKFYSFMMFYVSQIFKKRRIFHILQLVGGFKNNWKICLQIGSFSQVVVKIQNRWNHQIVNCLCNYIHHRSFTVKIRPFPTGSWAFFRGKLAVKLRGGVLKHQQYWG